MNPLTIKEIWKNLKYSGNMEFEFTRIDSNSIPDIYLGINSKSNRCLLLELPENNYVDFKTTVKENLTLTLFKDINYIVLELTENSYQDLFNDLVFSIYQRIYDLTNLKEYTDIFIQMFYKWSNFFSNKKSDRLSFEQIKGLFGELFVLKSILLKNNSIKIDDILKSWRGPYDEGHDFVLENKDIEVKTKDHSKEDIRISSEFQLEKTLGKELELLVVSVENDLINGITIKVLIEDIKKVIIKKLGDITILFDALMQKGVTQKNIIIYDNYKFKIINQIRYNCSEDNFPKLIKSNINPIIKNVKYSLRLNLLKDFIINIDEELND